MEPIKLSIEQKEKLLEMCNKLFPKEGIWIKILDEDIYYSKNGKFPGFKIHWFEFCYEHLLSRLNLSVYRYTRFKQEMGNIHIIDYLYEEFKKLKL